MLSTVNLARLSRDILKKLPATQNCKHYGEYETCTKAKSIPITHEIHDIIKWRRPERLPFHDPQKSCDLKPLPPIDPNWLKVEYEPFKELLDALPEEQRKLFTVDFAQRKEGVKVIHQQTYKTVRRHKYDGIVEQSIEQKVAWFTVKIRDLREILSGPEIQRNNGIFKKQAKELVEKRKKWLNHLRHVDYKRFEWLIETLGILFKPNVQFQKIKRRDCVNKLTDILCEEIKSRKLEAYKVELDEQKIPFLEEKLAILKEIQSDEESMKLTSSVNDEIAKTEKRLEKLRKTFVEIKPLKEEVVETDVVFS